MKVLFVSSGNSGFFKTAPFIISQGESLIKEGVNVKYYYIKGKGIKGYLKNIKLLKSEIKKFKPDIIHAHYSLTGWVVLFSSLRIPKVLSLMGSDTSGFLNQDGKKTILSYLMRLQVNTIEVFYKTIIVKSENLKNALKKKQGVYIIPNGVNFDIFKQSDLIECRKKLNLPKDKKILLFLGNVQQKGKNYPLLENSLKYIKSQNIHICAPFPVKHNLIPQYLSACNLLVFPSLNEGSPNVIKEALACNTKIVATPSGDIIERTNGLSNVLISKFDSIDLADKIDILLNDQTPINSRELIRNDIDEKVIAKKLIKIYEQIQR